jgi:hypothetical protein
MIRSDGIRTREFRPRSSRPGFDSVLCPRKPEGGPQGVAWCFLGPPGVVLDDNEYTLKLADGRSGRILISGQRVGGAPRRSKCASKADVRCTSRHR